MLWQNKNFIVNLHRDGSHFHLMTKGGSIYSLVEDRNNDPLFATSADLLLYLSSFSQDSGEAALKYLTK